MKDQFYDYVIVGSGTGGSLVANRLSAQKDCSVLVIEAGGMDRGFWLKLPVGYYKTIYNLKFSKLYRSEADEKVLGRQIDCPRGRVVGGSSSINGLIFIRGQREDFDDWEKMGAKGWNNEEVLPYFKKFEKFSGKKSQYRGTNGELSVEQLKNDSSICNAWLQAARGYGLPSNPDFNGASSYGVGKYNLSLCGRWRESSATAFLHPALKRNNMHIMTRTMVKRVLFKDKVAIGVEVIRNNVESKIYANKEVILCAGVVQTPQILELSGIGQKDRLQKLGIEVLHHSSEVGENLQDHLQMRTVVELAGKGSLNDDVRNPLKLIQIACEWLFGARGPLTVGAGQVGGAVHTKYAKDGRPDLQLFVMPLSVDKPGMPLHKYSGFTTSLWKCHPESVGSIHIKDISPFSDPVIDTNYLSAEKDQKVMVEGIKIVREIYNRPEFRDLWSREVIPGKQYQSDAEILKSIRKYSNTVYHLVGTCRMGSDKNAVVDSRLRVNGVKNLRIIDASVMPKITSANTNAPTYMIGEKGASFVIEDRETSG